MSTEILRLLIAERDRLNRAIEALQGPMKRRGRPPKNQLALSVVAEDAPKKRKPFSVATKRKMAQAQKKRWASKKATE